MIVIALFLFLKIWQRCLVALLHKNTIPFVYDDLLSHATSSFAFSQVCGQNCSFLISTIITGVAQSKKHSYILNLLL